MKERGRKLCIVNRFQSRIRTCPRRSSLIFFGRKTSHCRRPLFVDRFRSKTTGRSQNASVSACCRQQRRKGVSSRLPKFSTLRKQRNEFCMNGPVQFFFFFLLLLVVVALILWKPRADSRLQGLRWPRGSGHVTGRPCGMFDVKRVCELARGVQFVSARMFAGRAQFGLCRLVILRETFKQVLSVSSGSTPVQLFFLSLTLLFFFFLVTHSKRL